MHSSGLPTDPSVRRRAYWLGFASAAVLLLAAGSALVATKDSYSALTTRAAIQTVDSIPLVLRGALSGVLLWALVLVIFSLRALSSPARLSSTPVGARPIDAMAQRIALILLAVSAMSSIAIDPVAAHADTIVSTTSDNGRSALAVPGFSGPPDRSVSATPDLPSAPESCPPSPGWTAPAPARTGSAGCASAPLVTGGAGRSDRSADDCESVVRRGDSLWSLVARHLQTDDPASIAAEWPRWYAANREIIGPDPDLLSVGQILHLPVPTSDSPNLRGVPK